MKSHRETDEWYGPAIKFCFASKLYCLHRVLEVTPECSSEGHRGSQYIFSFKDVYPTSTSVVAE